MIAKLPASAPDNASDVRVIAFCRLTPASSSAPQISEPAIDAAWADVVHARPRFVGHRQPQVPAELGCYDMRDREVHRAQVALARAYGIHGFCYMVEWPDASSGQDSLLADIVASGEPDFPFCLCLDNEDKSPILADNDGATDSARAFGVDDGLALIRAWAPILRNRRCLRIDGRPLLLIARSAAFGDSSFLAGWRDECVALGVGNPYLCVAITRLEGTDAERAGFDASLELPPHGYNPASCRERLIITDPAFGGEVRDYRSYVAQALSRPRPDHPVFRSASPGWDETPRHGSQASVFSGSTPEIFGFWIERIARETRLRFAGDRRLMFIRSWNEWDNGCHLEPDTRTGRQFLEAMQTGLARAATGGYFPRPAWNVVRAWGVAGGGIDHARVVRAQRRQPADATGSSVSVVMPAYNHQRYVVQALDSVVAQTHRNLEIVVIDDGSTDETGALLDEFAARCTTHPVTVVHQANAGAHEALNHGLALARGDTIALMNSDDLYAPERLERLLAAMATSKALLGFSNTMFIDDDGNEIGREATYVGQLREAIAGVKKLPSPLHAMFRHNVAISTGNLVIDRRLFESTGGFCAMRICHDWDFLMAASYLTSLEFVDQPLYLYRLHDANTFSGGQLLGGFEIECLMTRFFADFERHPMVAKNESRARFIEYARSAGLRKYLPATFGDLRKR